LLERLVARQIIKYLTGIGLLLELQSEYRVNLLMETALLEVLADILRAFNSGDLAVLTLMDLSAAFDTVDSPMLLHRLRTFYGFRDSVFAWFASYGRSQHVCCGSSNSHPCCC
jgi:hypothetical protein